MKIHEEKKNSGLILFFCKKKENSKQRNFITRFACVRVWEKEFLCKTKAENLKRNRIKEKKNKTNDLKETERHTHINIHNIHTFIHTDEHRE